MKHSSTPHFSIVAAVLLQAGSAAALAEPLVQLQLAQAEIEHQIILGDGPEALLHSGGALAQQRVVKGAPYCAEAVHETVQWLADGAGGAPNRIVRQQISRLCRDGDGRTRQEVERGARKLVYLHDPVARENWLLDPERKTARRLAGGHDPMGTFDAGAMREFSERMREWARGFADAARSGRPVPVAPPVAPVPPSPPVPPTAGPGATPAPVLITRGDDGQRHTELRVLRLPPGAEGPAGEWALPPPAVQWRANSLAPRSGGSTSPLPAKEIEGLRANGERTTWVIEAGKVGNEKAIQITREVWTAPELMLTLSSRDFDPRSGEVNYRLRSLKRGEPDAALMRVPPDFRQPARPGGKASQPTG